MSSVSVDVEQNSDGYRFYRVIGPHWSLVSVDVEQDTGTYQFSAVTCHIEE
jgi:hypothetical protein